MVPQLDYRDLADSFKVVAASWPGRYHENRAMDYGGITVPLQILYAGHFKPIKSIPV
jgi:hypothetical protein